MKAWSAIAILVVLTAAYWLNRGEEKPVEQGKTVSEVKPSEEQKIEEPKQVTKAPAAQEDDAQSLNEAPVEPEQNDEVAAVEETPQALAQPEEKLEPQIPAPELPLWTPPKPKAHDEMWTLREVRKADMSDRTLFLITYGQSPSPNFKVEAWEPGILVQDEH